MTWRPMTSAPADGSRVLVKHQPQLFDPRPGKWRYVDTPHTAVCEARFYDRRWQEWCGDALTQSTTTLNVLAWTNVPE